MSRISFCSKSELICSFVLNLCSAYSVVRPFHSVGAGTPSNMPTASLFTSTSASTRNYNSNGRLSRFETPGLTPIPANTPGQGQSPSDAGDSKVLKRAEQVAARLYYQPSPETPHTAEIRTSLQYLRGLGRQVEYESTPGTGETPVRRGGGCSKENSKVAQSSMSSSFSRQPRTLFMPADISSTRSLEVEEQRGGADGSQSLDEDLSAPTQCTKQDSIKEILGLLCLLGSGWRRLCQVRLPYGFLKRSFAALSSSICFRSYISTGAGKPCTSSANYPRLSRPLGGS
jgi:hypothetical protein